MRSILSLYRVMLAIWCLLVLVMGVTVTHWARSPVADNLLAFLFTRDTMPKVQRVLPTEPPPLPKPKAPEPPAPETKPEPPAPPPQWQPLPQGRQPGKGVLEAPSVDVMTDGSVVVTFAYAGQLGQGTQFPYPKREAQVADIHGAWQDAWNRLIARRFDSGCLRLLQIANHGSYVRVSGVSRTRPAKLDLRVERDAGNHVRVVFSPSKDK